MNDSFEKMQSYMGARVHYHHEGTAITYYMDPDTHEPVMAPYTVDVEGTVIGWSSDYGLRISGFGGHVPVSEVTVIE